MKDNYHLPKIDYILRKVVGANKISMIDGFLGYNHSVNAYGGPRKNYFTISWGTFMYDKLPFGLINAEATF